MTLGPIHHMAVWRWFIITNYTFAFGKHGIVILPIFIKPLYDTTMQQLDFKVDTGADTTTASKAELKQFGFDMDWIKNNALLIKDEDKPRTASGDTINAGYIQLPLINLLGYEGRLWPFLIIMDEDKDFRNLLGRDLLIGFNYTFNNDDDIFSIHRTKSLKKRYGFHPGQEISAIDM